MSKGPPKNTNEQHLQAFSAPTKKVWKGSSSDFIHPKFHMLKTDEDRQVQKSFFSYQHQLPTVPGGSGGKTFLYVVLTLVKRNKFGIHNGIHDKLFRQKFKWLCPKWWLKDLGCSQNALDDLLGVGFIFSVNFHSNSRDDPVWLAHILSSNSFFVEGGADRLVLRRFWP